MPPAAAERERDKEPPGQEEVVPGARELRLRKQRPVHAARGVQLRLVLELGFQRFRQPDGRGGRRPGREPGGGSAVVLEYACRLVHLESGLHLSGLRTCVGVGARALGRT